MSKTYNRATYNRYYFRHPRFHHQAQKAVHLTIDQFADFGLNPRPRELKVLVRSVYDDIVVSNWKTLVRKDSHNDKNSTK